MSIGSVRTRLERGLKNIMYYRILNAAFHFLHIFVITFVAIGWIYPPFHLAHFVLTLLTLGSWFILGHWFGVGYCPLTDWHWKIKSKLSGARPNGTYIHLGLERVTGRQINPDRVDRVVLLGTILIAGLSLMQNILDWWH